MKSFFLNILVLSSLDCVLGSVVRQGYTDFYYYETSDGAREACSNNPPFGDWALLSHADEVEQVETPQGRSYMVWIGLKEEDGGTAEWIDGTPSIHSASDASREKTDHYWSQDYCAYIIVPDEKTIGFTSCWSHQHFYCYGGSGQSPVTYIPYAMSWTSAQIYCQKNYIDLVVLKEEEQFNELPDPGNTFIWTGIRRAGPDGDWSPDSGIGKPIYADWAEGQPTSDGDCVGLSIKDKKLANIDCSFSLSFYCFQDNLVLVKENKTWEEALEFCNAMQWEDPSLQYYDYININLISYSDLDHYTMWSTIQEAKTDEVWTGLRYLGHQWFWVDGTDLQYEDLPQCPDLGQHCGTLDRDNITIPWRIRDCTEKRNFLCYRGQPGFYPHYNG